MTKPIPGCVHSSLVSRHVVRCVIVLLMVAIGLVPLPAPVAATPEATPAASPVSDAQSPEQALVDRFAPIVMLRRQQHVCDPNGEPYIPLPVEAVLNDPQVLLRRDEGADDASFDPIVMTGPGIRDIAGLGQEYYLDFPGNPLQPDCHYERWSRSKLESYSPTIYARIAWRDNDLTILDEQAAPDATPPEQFATAVAEGETDVDSHDAPLLPVVDDAADQHDGLVIQYWMFYVYNDFNNLHEADWEMVQLNFEAETITDAMNSEPRVITLAQHGGAERVAWDSSRVQRVGTHPVVYPAAGSHATYFSQETYIGWGESGTGFGCDTTTLPSMRVDPLVRLMPTISEQRGDAWDWMTFTGRWGEKQPWEFNGPRGPVAGRKWYRPVTWIDTVRGRSVFVPHTTGMGPMPAQVFCRLTDMSAQLLVMVVLRPWLSFGMVAAGFAAIILCITLIRRHIVRAMHVYWRYRGSFTSISIVLIPLGLAVTLAQQVLLSIPPMSILVDLIGQSPVARLLTSLLIGGLLGIVEGVLIGPAVIALMEMIRRNQPTDTRLAYRHVRAHLASLGRGWLSVVPGLILRAVTVIGIPLAIRDRVRWAFYTQAIMIDRAQTWNGARSVSAVAVSGMWWRTALKTLMYAALTVLPGPIIGLTLLVIFSPSIEFVNLLSSVVYAFVVPYKFIALTLMYYTQTDRLKQFDNAFAAEDAPDSKRGTMPGSASPELQAQ